MIRFALAAAAAFLLAAEPGQAAVYTSISPNQLERLLAGEKGTVEVDLSDEDTTLDGRVDSTSYTVFFYECDGAGFKAPAKPDSACLGFEYRAYFSDFPSDSETVNEWNDNYHYGSLWRDSDGDLALQLNVIVEGGITDDNIRVTFDWWRAVIESFQDFMKDR